MNGQRNKPRKQMIRWTDEQTKQSFSEKKYCRAILSDCTGAKFMLILRNKCVIALRKIQGVKMTRQTDLHRCMRRVSALKSPWLLIKNENKLDIRGGGRRVSQAGSCFLNNVIRRWLKKGTKASSELRKGTSEKKGKRDTTNAVDSSLENPEPPLLY